MMQIWIFSIITPVFSITWSFRNHSNMLICCSINISYYYQCWKQLCCLILLVKPWYFVLSGFFEGTVQKNSLYLKQNVIHVFTITFDQFKASLLNKDINFFQKIITDPKLLSCSIWYKQFGAWWWGIWQKERLILLPAWHLLDDLPLIHLFLDVLVKVIELGL